MIEQVGGTPLPARRGIYAITNTRTGTIYYGQSLNMERRLRDHVSSLNRGKHRNIRLQRSWDKNGASVFTFAPLFVMPFGNPDKWERACINGRRATGNAVYNIADPLHIEPLCDETRAKMSISRLGNKIGRAHV